MNVYNIYKEPMLDGDVYIGRAGHGRDSYFGNPFPLGGESRGSTLRKYEEYARNRIETDPEFRQRVKELYGKRLFCFCHPQSCHGDILEKITRELNEHTN